MQPITRRLLFAASHAKSSALAMPIRRYSAIVMSQGAVNNVGMLGHSKRTVASITSLSFQSHRHFAEGKRGGSAQSGAEREAKAFNEVAEVLKNLKGEDGKSIDDMGLIHSLGIDVPSATVSVKLNLSQNYRKVKQLIVDKVSELSWVQTVKVEMAPRPQQEERDDNKRLVGVRKVKNIIAVSSCKGGVGKSTVAVNLAFSLRKQGHSVGIFDADMFGPSLPTMIKADVDSLYQDENDPNMIAPILFSGVKCMSYGFATAGRANQAAVMRGPMVSNLVSQLVGQTNWGDLDYLVIDFPPGTGDIQLTLGQELNLSGAVIVTTPQKLSYVDVVKGIELFDSLKVPTLALVENMSYFKCGNCETKQRIFGAGFNEQIKESYGIVHSVEVPIVAEIASMSDSGTPFVLSLPESFEIVETYSNLAAMVHQEIEVMSSTAQVSTLSFDAESGKVVCEVPDPEDCLKRLRKLVDPRELRLKCRCAACVDEIDGRQILQPNKVPKDVHPKKMVKKGNYAVAVVWSDGHNSSLYSYERVMSDEIEGEVQRLDGA